MPLSISTMKVSVGELQRDYLHKLVVERYPASMNAAFASSAAVSGAVDLYVSKGIFPNRKTANIELKWSGESYYHSGPDASTKTGSFTFRLDEKMLIKDFWEAAKDLTGNLVNHAALNKPEQTLTLGVYLINVGKNVVTDYRRLVDVLVYSVDSITIDKEGSNVSTFTVEVSWDRSERDDKKRGMSI
jgi:hypothetical protein